MITARRLRTAILVAVGAALCLLMLPREANGQQAVRDATNCAACHGELELLRQHAPSPARARQLLVTSAVLRGTGHDDFACTQCHTGFATFPHPEGRTRTESCASCHEPEDAAWTGGEHAVRNTAGEINATCTACHGIHDVATAEALANGRGMERMNEQCVACHQTAVLPVGDPHRGEVGCWSCHEAHRVHPVDHPAAAVAPIRQAQTCGACHDAEVIAWRTDAHGSAFVERATLDNVPLVLPADTRTPVCSACHGGHGMVSAEHEDFARIATELCSQCHQHAARTFFDSYHGKATALGSRVSAGCHDCHTAHAVFPDQDPRSTVHRDNLIETCQPCHEYARPAFVLYDSHPDFFNRERNPWIFFSFWFMNALLVGVLTVFGAHTLLWWIRLWIDKRRGHGHH